MSRRLSPAVVTLLGALAACTYTAKNEEGSVEVIAKTSSAITVDSVSVTASKGGTTQTTDLTLSGSTWHGTLTAIPTGAWTFGADAYASGVVTYSVAGAGPFTIAKDQTATVSLTLQPVAAGRPAAFSNTAPTITSLFVSNVDPGVGDVISLVVAASDPDVGDTLTYQWSDDADGLDTTFSDPNAAATTWQGQIVGTPTLSIAVTDSHGATAGANVTISQQGTNLTGEVAVTTTVNTWPVIGGSGLTASPALVAVGGATSLAIVANDPDGDTVSYAWTAGPGCTGTFDDDDAATTAFHLASATGDTCRVQVHLTDGKGGSNDGSFVLQVGTTPSVEVGP